MPATTTKIYEERRKRNQEQQRQGKAKSKEPKDTVALGATCGGPLGYYGLLASVAILLGLGLLMVVSASSGEAIINQVSQTAQKAADAGKNAGLIDIEASVWGVGLKHLVSIFLGILIAWIISRINYRALEKFMPLLGVGLFILLLAVRFFGVEANNAKRWIVIAGQSVQPSEFAKPILFLIVVFALYAMRKKGNAMQGDRRTWLQLTALVLPSVGLIYMQPETGNILVFILGVIVAYIILELPLKNLAVALSTLGVVGVIGALSKDYRRERILQYLGLAEKSSDANWQVRQAELAFGSGGLSGVGPGLSRQKYFYLPEAQNDFIIAIIGEELGLLGTATVIAAFLGIVFFGFRIAYQAKDSLGRAIAGGSVAMLAGQAVLNIFSVTGLGPVTGKPLPFVTLGGSSMLTSFIMLGLILSVARFGMQPEKAPALGERPVSSRPSSLRGAQAPAQREEREHAQPRERRDAHREKKPPREQRARARGKGRKPSEQSRKVEEDFDEDSLEWRWDSGAHLSSPRRRR